MKDLLIYGAIGLGIWYLLKHASASSPTTAVAPAMQIGAPSGAAMQIAPQIFKIQPVGPVEAGTATLSINGLHGLGAYRYAMTRWAA